MKSNLTYYHSRLVPLKEIPPRQRALLYSLYGTPRMDTEEVDRTHQGTGNPTEPYTSVDRHRLLSIRMKICGGIPRK